MSGFEGINSKVNDIILKYVRLEFFKRENRENYNIYMWNIVYVYFISC